MSKPSKQAEDSFESRWSPEVLALGFYQKPNCFSRCLSELGLNVREVAILDLLFTYAFNNAELPSSYPSVGTIAESLGMAYSTVGTHIRSLEAKGFIKREYRTGKSNLFILGPSITIIRRHMSAKHSPRFRGGYSSKMRTRPSSKSRTKEESPKKSNFEKSEPIPINEIIAARYGQHSDNDI